LNIKGLEGLITSIITMKSSTEITEYKPNILRYRGKKQNRYLHGLHIDLRPKDLDGRTVPGQMVKVLGRYLREYIGQSTAASEVLINRIVFKAVKLSIYESHCFSQPLKDLDPFYLPMTNSLRQDLIALGQMTN